MTSVNIINNKINKMTKSFIALCLCTLLFSCDRKVSSEFPEILFNELQYKLNLPDTVIANKPYTVTIEFKSDFDTIIDAVQLSPHDSNKVRLITYYRYEPVRSPMKTIGELIKIDSTFVRNKNFEIENVVFREKGEFIYSGLIKDVIMYNHYNERGIRDTVSFEELKQQIHKKVIVVE